MKKKRLIISLSIVASLIIGAVAGLAVQSSLAAEKHQAQYNVSGSGQAVQPDSVQLAQAPVSGDEDVIGVESAKQIASDHAGVNVNDALYVKAYLDHDDGYKVYEIDFQADGFEYDYEINAVSGEILEWDKDRIDWDD